MISEFTIPTGLMTSVEYVDTDKLLVELNMKRYSLYKSLFDDEIENVRDMKISPMFEFITKYVSCKKSGEKFNYINTRYYEMQKLYGRTHSFAVVKASNFMKLYEDIKIKGISKPPLVILDDDGLFQIKDGHHRIACCMALGMKRIPCRTSRGKMIS